MLDAGADKVSVNSAAVARPELLAELAEVFGAQCVVLAIDARAAGRTAPTSVTSNGGRTRGRARRRRVGARGRRARGGGDPADEHGPRRHRGRLRAGADAGGGRRRRRAGDRLGRRGHARPPRGRGRARAAPTPCCAPRSSTTASTRCARPRSACGRRASRCGCDELTRATCASASGACPAWSGCCPRSRACRRPTSWAARCATCCAARPPSTSTSRWRATRASVARALAERLGGDGARARALRHRDGARPGPQLRPRDHPARDLRRAGRAADGRAAPRSRTTCGRRDFTVNAMAVGLTGDDLGPPLRPARRPRRPRGRRRARAPRRAASSTTPPACCGRCATRRGSASRSTRTPSAARDGGGRRTPSSTVSGARIRDELMDLLAEHEAPAAVERMRDLGHRSRRWTRRWTQTPSWWRRRSLGAPAIGADRRSRRWPRCARGARGARRLARRPAPPGRGERDAVARAPRGAPELARGAARARAHALGAARPARAGAAGGAGAGPGAGRARRSRSCAGSRAAARSRSRSRRRRPAGGRRPGGRRRSARALGETLRRKLDGLVAGRDEELETALEASAVSDAQSSCSGARAVVFTTRQGGVSDGPYELAEPRHPDRRRARARGGEPRPRGRAAGLEPERVAMGWQVHGTDLREWSGRRPERAFADPGGKELREVDGHLPPATRLGLLVLVADCYPVALSRRRAGGDAALRLARRWPAGSSRGRVARVRRAARRRRRARDRRLLLRGRAPRCSRRSPTSTGRRRPHARPARA